MVTVVVSFFSPDAVLHESSEAEKTVRTDLHFLLQHWRDGGMGL
jgi:hypothetical protein